MAKELKIEISQYYSTMVASVDEFFNSREIRYSRGLCSPEGCYEDTYNLSAIRDFTRQFKSGAFQKDILVFEGLFLMRSELIDLWDFSVHVAVDPDIASTRAIFRDSKSADSQIELEAKHSARYKPAQTLYMELEDPMSKVDCIIKNNDIESPCIIENEAAKHNKHGLRIRDLITTEKC